MEKLLILDDESLILKSLESLFEDDYEVFTTGDGEVALQLAIDHNIAVILCDERMPRLSGHEFLRRVREFSKATRMTMSGYADVGALTEVVNSGQIFAYISKPWDPLKLKAQVRSAVAHFKLVEEVEHERGLLRALMENIPDLIFFKDCQSRFTRVNDAHAQHLGARDAAECIGKSNADYHEPGDALRWRMEEEELIGTGLSQIDKIQQVRDLGTGDLDWWSTTKVPMFDRAGQVSGIAGISRNITALKNGEQELQRARTAAESANRAKSDFLTTMSHEMRTPMNAILGMADMLAASSLGEKQRDYVRVFQKAGASLLGLISDLLDFSKVESGCIKLESVGFDLSALLRRLIDLMTLRAQERGLSLALEVSPEIPTGLIGDPNRLWQILVNLVGNALKFTEQGSVTLRVEPEAGAAKAGWLRFNVVDTGIGVAADKTEMIFERFTQADSSTTRKFGGTGLGLAISKGLAELMGGRLECVSEVGKGSTFSVTVPFGIPQESEPPELADPIAAGILPANPAAPLSGYRILIAEDSEYNVLLIKAYLDDCGFTLDVAANGGIAVEKVMSGSADLVLMDMQMPVMCGLEATRAIRKWEAETHRHPVPILALTAHAGDEELAKSMEAGCTEHLTKPIKREVLLDAIARSMEAKIRVTPPRGIEHLVPEYLAWVRHEMSQTLEGLESNNCEIGRRSGHQFKGSGTGYGFPEIARTGAAVEVAAKACNGDEIRSQLLALSRYLDRVEITEPVPAGLVPGVVKRY